MKNELISRIMTPRPATVSPTSSVAAAERIMREQHCHHVPVVDDGRLVGMISAGDLIKALILQPESESLSQTSLETRYAAQIMQRKVTALPQTATLLDAAEALASGSVHALPVVALNNMLVGIVTSTDLLATLVDGLKRPAGESDAPASPGEQSTTDLQARMLRDVYRATKHYLESGRGELEHGRLLQAVNRARESLARAEIRI